MDIDGITIERNDNIVKCKINSLSVELQNIIRRDLQAVVHGYETVLQMPEYYTYKKTLAFFLERYNSKSPDTKKGMIGELLSHTLLPRLYSNLQSASIWKNKEERSIKKGFDIIYYDNLTNGIWYTEVKSGHMSPEEECESVNSALLDRAYSGIHEMLSGTRQTLWDSAMTDAQIVMGDNKSLNVRRLLSADCPSTVSPDTTNKSVILCSVVYNNPLANISIDSLNNYYKAKLGLKEFQNIIIISFAKQTYEAVSQFLEQEATS